MDAGGGTGGADKKASEKGSGGGRGTEAEAGGDEDGWGAVGGTFGGGEGVRGGGGGFEVELDTLDVGDADCWVKVRVDCGKPGSGHCNSTTEEVRGA